ARWSASPRHREQNRPGVRVPSPRRYPLMFRRSPTASAVLLLPALPAWAGPKPADLPLHTPDAKPLPPPADVPVQVVAPALPPPPPLVVDEDGKPVPVVWNAAVPAPAPTPTEPVRRVYNAAARRRAVGSLLFGAHPLLIGAAKKVPEPCDRGGDCCKQEPVVVEEVRLEKKKRPGPWFGCGQAVGEAAGRAMVRIEDAD